MQQQRFLTALSIAFALAATTARASQDSQFEFLFWPTPGVEKDTRFVKRVEGACGDLVVARVRAMPRPTAGDKLGTDVVFELNEKSRVVRTWYLPANAIPIATRNNELLFRDLSGEFLVGTNGTIRPFDEAVTLPESIEAQCRMPPSLRESGYARCHRVPRLKAQGTSLLAFQGPCT